MQYSPLEKENIRDLLLTYQKEKGVTEEAISQNVSDKIIRSINNMSSIGEADTIKSMIASSNILDKDSLY